MSIKRKKLIGIDSSIQDAILNIQNRLIPLEAFSALTYSNVTVYVAPATMADSPEGIVGNDTTGDGTAAHPFFSIEKAVTHLNRFRTGAPIVLGIACYPGTYRYGTRSRQTIRHPDCYPGGSSIQIVQKGTTLDPNDCVFEYSDDTQYFGGHSFICVWSWCSFSGIHFKFNTTTDYRYNGVWCYASAASISNCKFSGWAYPLGYLASAPTVTVSNCDFIGGMRLNNINKYGCLNIQVGAKVNLQGNNTFTNMSFGLYVSDGSALYCTLIQSEPNIWNKSINTFTNCVYGIYAVKNSKLSGIRTFTQLHPTTNEEVVWRDFIFTNCGTDKTIDATCYEE